MALITSTSTFRSVLTSGGTASGFPSVTPSARRHGTHIIHGQGATSLASPALRTPGMAGRITSVNDDEAERRKRRLETHMRTMMSPGCHTPTNAAAGTDIDRARTVEVGSSSLSNAQIADHYANCIKLSSENKINAKNAFGLHLIDYMLEVLRMQGEMTNFQVAGCTLDAGAKIYAGRVDSIYNDAYKMLGGLGRGDTKGGDGGEEGGEHHDEPLSRRKSKKSHVPASQTIEKNPKALDVNTFDLEFEVDPLFKKTSAAFDEGGVEGLLLNQLCIRDDNCALMLDAREVPPSSGAAMEADNMVFQDLRELGDLMQLQSLQICPTFASFKFTEYDDTPDKEDSWDVEHLLSAKGTQRSPLRNEYRPQPDTNYSMLQCPQPVVADDDDYDDGAGCLEPITEEDFPLEQQHLGSDYTAQETTVLGVCGDAQIAMVIPSGGQSAEKNECGALMSGVGDLCLSEAVAPSEYSYFNPAVVSTWAGPQHWRLRTRNTGKGEPSAEAKPKRKRQSKKQFQIDFAQIPDKMFTKGRASTKLSKATLSKMDVSQTTLPQDTHTDLDVLFKLFCRPKWKVRRHKRVAGQVEDNIDGEWYNYANANDNANYCPLVEGWRKQESDEEDNGEAGPLSFDEDFTQPMNETVPEFYNQTRGLLSFNDTRAPDSQDQLGSEPLVLAGDNLVTQPRKVQQIRIEYARTAKKLDVKKLKARMWEIITDDTEENKENKDENGAILSNTMETVKKSDGSGVNFSGLYSQLPSRVSTTTAKNLSIPICVVCLLHLANEKNLKITGVADMSDLHVQTASL